MKTLMRNVAAVAPSRFQKFFLVTVNDEENLHSDTEFVDRTKKAFRQGQHWFQRARVVLRLSRSGSSSSAVA